MHKVAIVKIVGSYIWYDDYSDAIDQSITEWEEVDDETFNLLIRAGCHQFGVGDNDTRFMVIEQLKSTSIPVVRNVQMYLDMVEKRKKAQEEANAAKRAKAEEK